MGVAIQWPNQCHQHVGAVVDSIRARWRTKQPEMILAIFAERVADAVDDTRIPREPLTPVALHPCAKGAHDLMTTLVYRWIGVVARQRLRDRRLGDTSCQHLRRNGLGLSLNELFDS